MATLAVACAPFGQPDAAAQRPPDDPSVTERTAVVVRDAFVAGRIGELADLRATVGGEPADVIAIGDYGDEPLTIVVVLDAVLGDTADLRRGALLVAGLSPLLTRLGTVRVVVLRSDGLEELLPATRDDTVLDELLSRLGFVADSEEALATVRLPWILADEAVAGVLGTDRAPPAREEAAAAAERAAVAIVRHRDRILSLATEPTSSGRRLMVFAGGGFDPCPGAFFGVEEPAPEATGCGAPDAPPDPGAELGPTLATLGWTVAAITIPVVSTTHKAWTFGPLDRIHPEAPVFFGVRGKVDGERNPKRARLYLEQAGVHLDAGELEAAARDAELALHHFGDARKTRSEQADAWRLLAVVYGEQRDASATARALARAQAAWPDGSTARAIAARLTNAYRAATKPFEGWAQATAGAAVAKIDELETAVSEIAERRRVTYQLPFPVATEPLALELRSAGRRLETVPWTSPSPTRLLSASRARRLWRDGAGDLEMRPPGIEVIAADHGAGELTIDLDLGSLAPEARNWITGPWRVTVLRSELIAEQHHVEPAWHVGDTERLGLRLPFEHPELPIELVLVEDLATGSWGFVRP